MTVPERQIDFFSTLQSNYSLQTNLDAALAPVTSLTASILSVPFAVISIYNQQHMHHLAAHGFTSIASNDTPVPLINITVNEDMLIVPDVRRDPRFQTHPLVTHHTHIHFYAGAALVNRHGERLGWLCAMDTVPRVEGLSASQREQFAHLAAIAMDTLQQHTNATVQVVPPPEARPAQSEGAAPAELLQATFTHNPQSIILLNSDMRLQAWNHVAEEAAQRTWSYPLSQGESIEQFLQPDHRAPFRHLFEQALQGRLVSKEVDVTDANEVSQWIEATCIPIFDAAGVVRQVCLITANINARQEAIHTLAVKEQQFHSIVQHFSDVVTLIDAQGNILYTSPSIRPVLGYVPEERPGQTIFDLVHPDDKARVFEYFARCVQQPGIAPPIEVRYQHASGHWVVIEAVSNNLLDEPGAGYIVINSRDITQRKQVEEELLLLKAAIQQISESIIITDAQLDFPGPHIVFVNAGFESLTGYRASEVIGKSPRILQGTGTDPAIVQRVRTDLEAGRPFQGETTNYRKDGSPFEISWSINPVHTQHDEISHFVSVQYDISDRKRAEQLEHDHRRILEMVVANQPLDTILTRCVNLVEHQYPESWCAIFLSQHEQYVCRAASAAVPVATLDVFAELISSQCVPPSRWSTEPVPLETLCSDDAHHTCLQQVQAYNLQSCVVAPLISSQNAVLGTFVVHVPAAQQAEFAARGLLALMSKLAAVVIEQRQLVEQLEYLAYHDMLTDLPNRLLFERHLQATLEEAQSSNTEVALLFIDLDRFKQVNDSLGHHIGDQLLGQVANRMRDCLGDHMLLARLGGDEFACVIDQLHNSGVAVEIAQQIVASFHEPFLIETHQLFLTANIGISLYPLDGKDSLTLQRNADIAMYRTKRRGVSGIQFFTSDMNITLREPLLEMVEIEEHLRRASIFDELRLHYQPQFDLASGQLVGVEALLRWEHPSLGMIPPGKFIPITERINMIRPIGAWVLRQACQQAAAWQRLGYPPLVVSVNVSAEQFAEQDFVAIVTHILQENKLESHWLELELTESLMLSDFEMTQQHLMAFKQLGVRISLDDFGTGHAVLSHLQHMPIDSIKIDKSFIQNLQGDRSNLQQTKDLIQTIIVMAHKLNMITVLEGVETRQQMELSREMQCDRVQGYWFGIPMPASECELLLQRHAQSYPASDTASS